MCLRFNVLIRLDWLSTTFTRFTRHAPPTPIKVEGCEGWHVFVIINFFWFCNAFKFKYVCTAYKEYYEYVSVYRLSWAETGLMVYDIQERHFVFILAENNANGCPDSLPLHPEASVSSFQRLRWADHPEDLWSPQRPLQRRETLYTFVYMLVYTLVASWHVSGQVVNGTFLMCSWVWQDLWGSLARETEKQETCHTHMEYLTNFFVGEILMSLSCKLHVHINWNIFKMCQTYTL